MSSAERTPRERVNRERAFTACQEWCDKSDGRYEIIAHLDDIGCRPFKNWFLLSDTSIRTDRLMTLVQLPPDCVALEELPPSESPNAVIMELLGSLQHPYVYPVLDMGFFFSNQTQYACLVMPFNARGSLKDLIYKVSTFYDARIYWISVLFASLFAEKPILLKEKSFHARTASHFKANWFIAVNSVSFSSFYLCPTIDRPA